ncbi:MAG: undecaprenyl/decaprenyl-phosphate alpha-N-acetylglucosaminyl 1-phosphate transferase [Propionibacteriaceae bacterium]|jgi:UDP-GlcNAc:undecaprenyl-phosphate GlcNAc-1-phosphate transferase|nr:undecaprenyl/decaprenyl-phosphate alpha-N-acetylglucosaminyl 1-phosphate transferase [Propionibacteriaceae bacterium]
MRAYLLVFLVAVGVTYLLCGLARRLAFRFNAVAKPRGRDIHARPIPYFGGLAMLFGLAAAFLLAVQLPWFGSFPMVTHDALALLAAGAVICIIGVIDDWLDISALTKVAGQLLAAGIAVINGVKIYWIPLPEDIIALPPGLDILLTLFIIVFCVNAVNLVDGLDGLAAGVVAIGSSAFFAYAYLLSFEQEIARATTASLVTVATVGICVGFLPWNVHKARMFMGDSGSMLLGFLMASSLISLTGQIDPSQLSAPGTAVFSAFLPLIIPIAALALPFLDTVMAYVRRTLKGEPFFRADKDHLHHRILRLGHGHLKAVNLLWFWSALCAYGVVVIGLYPSPYSIGGVLLGILIAAYLTWGKRLRRRLAKQ